MFKLYDKSTMTENLKGYNRALELLKDDVLRGMSSYTVGGDEEYLRIEKRTEVVDAISKATRLLTAFIGWNKDYDKTHSEDPEVASVFKQIVKLTRNQKRALLVKGQDDGWCFLEDVDPDIVY